MSDDRIPDIAGKIPAVDSYGLKSSDTLATWDSYVQSTFDYLGLISYIEEDKHCPDGPTVTDEQKDQWDKERAKAVWVLKASIAGVWETLVKGGLNNYEKSPRVIYKSVMAEYRKRKRDEELEKEWEKKRPGIMERNREKKRMKEQAERLGGRRTEGPKRRKTIKQELEEDLVEIE